MADIRSGLSGPGVESGGLSDDELLDRHFARASGGSSGSPTRATRAPSAKPHTPRGRGKHAPHYRGTPTGESTGKVSPPPELVAAILGPDSTSVADGLRHVSNRPVAPRQTADEIRAEARARDPKSWDRAQAMRGQMHERGASAVANAAELELWRFNAALQNGDDAEIFQAALTFAERSPAAFREWASLQDTQAILEADEYGEEVDEAQLPGYLLQQDVFNTLERERAEARLDYSERMLASLTEKNVNEYGQRLADAGLAPDVDNEQSVAYYEALSEWVAESVGHTPGELAHERPDAAADLLIRADEQMRKLGNDLTTHAVHKQILGVETANVNEGLESAADRENKKLDTLIDLQRAQLGQEPAGAPPLPWFQPDLELEPTREETEDPTATVGEFRQSLMEGEGVKSDSAWSKNGEPVSYEEASRDEVREEQVSLEARDRVMGLPRSL
jgi:hypothetical protein